MRKTHCSHFTETQKRHLKTKSAFPIFGARYVGAKSMKRVLSARYGVFTTRPNYQSTFRNPTLHNRGKAERLKMESALLSLAGSSMSIFPFSTCVNVRAAVQVARLSTVRLQPRLSWGTSSGDLRRSRLRFAASYAAGGGGDGGSAGTGGGGGGGDGAAEGGEAKPTAVAPGAADDPALSADVIVLGVGGMTCGGCAESVRKILESQPQVSSASVNHKTETAIVWPVPDAKAAPNWRKDIGEALAKHLTDCGFKSNLKVLDA